MLDFGIHGAVIELKPGTLMHTFDQIRVICLHTDSDIVKIFSGFSVNIRIFDNPSPPP